MIASRVTRAALLLYSVSPVGVNLCFVSHASLIRDGGWPMTAFPSRDGNPIFTAWPAPVLLLVRIPSPSILPAHLPTLHNMDMSSGSAGSSMMSGLHTSGGDTLLFNSLRPTSPGALAGAALVLFAIAVLERWLAATRIVLDANWHKRCVYCSCSIVIALIVSSALAGVSIKSSQLYYAPMQEKTDEAACHQDEGPSTLPSSPAKQAIPSLSLSRPSRTIAPFSLRHDLARGALHSLSLLLIYTLMLSVM